MLKLITVGRQGREKMINFSDVVMLERLKQIEAAVPTPTSVTLEHRMPQLVWDIHTDLHDRIEVLAERLT